MIYVGDHFHAEFCTVAPSPIRCALGPEFYVLLFSDLSAVYNGRVHQVCFVVPTHYPSFVSTMMDSKPMALKESVELLFNFRSDKDKQILAKYVENIQDTYSLHINGFDPMPKKILKKLKAQQN
ncbi:hypothetical protein CWI42_040580 [Ordospora colligata]|uniref:Uncharacterized protein n=1 Tax=Ordospora colligata OC4 TaxID=1354746 RepID=A0A0B2ULL0_9MICR|nr:uncharacterized protein M896_040580 [Ordospora colligata OC4]KHN69865.1 hypothetical protein M896_040580 [Ordospora colligata OC4]TBU16035.1 hypothetical protein CWI41_040580 [Ordospora colligata]TBU16248.1 hypothetical protein CWI40_040580 [Ordospora colligata]TBU18952.1 hypothetical protein CWI42_040580 [Ordospora colligata]